MKFLFVHIGVRLLPAALACSFTACGWLYPPKPLEDSVHAYPQIAEDLPAVPFEPLFPIGVEEGRFPVTKEKRVAPPSALFNVVTAEGGIRIQKLEHNHWIVVAHPASSTWTRLHGFLNARGWPVLRSEVADARLWVRRDNREAGAALLMFRIEQGFQANTSEVHLRQYIPAKEKGKQLMVVPDLAVLQELADYFAASSDVPVESLLAHTVRTGKKVLLESDAEGGRTLLLRVPMMRAWAAVGKVLREGDVGILEEDTVRNRYTVTPSTEKKDGWFQKRRWFGGEPALYEILLRAEDSKLTRVVVRPVDARDKKSVAQGEELLLYIRKYLV